MISSKPPEGDGVPAVAAPTTDPTLGSTAEKKSVPPDEAKIQKPEDKLAPLDELLKLLPDEHKATGSRLITEITGLVTARPKRDDVGAPKAPAPPTTDRLHLRSSDPSYAPKGRKEFVK